MTAKRFTMIYFETDGNLIFDETKHDSEWYDSTECLQDNEILKLLNELSDENGQLKTQLQNTSDQRDEFHRGARENANRVGKLKKENEHIKHTIKTMMETERTHIGQNTLKQLWEAIQ